MTDQLLYEAGGVSLDLMAPPFTAEYQSSWGQWDPVTTTAVSAFLDGEVVSGDGTSNRLISLRVLVAADSRAVLAQACESLVSMANQPSATLSWLSDDGPAQVFETYRAGQLERLDDERLGALERRYHLSIPARPWVRSLARQQAVASPPTVSLDDMEASAPGVAMGRQVPGVYPSGMSKQGTGAPMVDPSTAMAASLIGAGVQGSALSVTGGTRADGTSGTRPVSVVTATATGVVGVASSAAFAVSSDWVTVAWLVEYTTAPYFRVFQAGLEWLDAGGLVVRTDWGPPVTFNAINFGGPWTAWQASPRPDDAVSARPRLRYTAAGAGESFQVIAVRLAPSAGGTVTPTSQSHDGSGAAKVSVLTETDVYTGSAWLRYGPDYLSRRLPAPVDVSGQVRIRAWLRCDKYLLGVPGLRLWDSAGNWTRWDLPQSVPVNTWIQVAADLASPTESSSTPCDLTNVVAWDLHVSQYAPIDNTDAYTLNTSIDSITVGPADSPTLSPRGTVLTLGPIQGSARTTAALQLSSSLPMTDWLVACIDGTQGDPLLAITGNAAVGAGYDGTYSVLVGMAPAAAPANPTLVVAQKVGTTTVATRTLTGIVREGSRYIDYGAVELPLVRTAVENTGVTYTFTLAPVASQYADLLVIDVNASMMWVPSLPTPRRYGWVDEPSPTSSMGPLYVGDAADRSDAIATIGPPVPGRPLHVSGPSVRLLPYSTAGAPSVMTTYWPRWGAEALL